MDVEYLALEVSNEPRAQDAHEAGQNDELGFESIEFLCDNSIKGFAIRKLSMFMVRSVYVDYDFFRTYGIELLAGRPFSREFVADPFRMPGADNPKGGS